MPHDLQPGAPTLAGTHANHDEVLVARYAADDLDEPGRVAVEAWVGSCLSCSDLVVDLRNIALALRESRAPRRIRDFRLTEADAARLRPRGWRRIYDALTANRRAWVRPLGPALAALGVIGLLVGTFSLGGAGSLASRQALNSDTLSGGSAAPAAGVPSGAGGGNFSGAVPGSSAAPSAVTENHATGALSPVTPPSPASVSSPAAASPNPVDLGQRSASGSPPSAGAAAIPLVPAASSAPGTAGNTKGAAARETAAGGPAVTFQGLVQAASVLLLLMGVGIILLRWAVSRSVVRH